MLRVLFPCLCLGVAVEAGAIKPDRKYIRYPYHSGLIYEPLEVVTTDGYKIETWFYPAQEVSDTVQSSDRPLPFTTLDDAPRPTLIICNADAANMSYYQMVLAACYAANGYNVVTFDWRGFGASDPFDMDTDYLCYTEMLLDYDAVIGSVARCPYVDADNIFLFGWSTGAYLSMIAAQRNDVRGCILRGCITSFDDAIPVIKLRKGEYDRNLIVPADFPLKALPLSAAPDFQRDVMLIVGENDTRTPPWMSQQIYDALPNDIYKELWIVPGAKHSAKDAPEFMALPQFLSRTISFMETSAGRSDTLSEKSK